MADAPDLDALARRFLDLWQAQVTRAVSDPALAARMAMLAAPFVAPGAPAPDKPEPDKTEPGETAVAPASTAAATGTPAARAASSAGEPVVDQLARRLAACEERLAALESRLDAAGGAPRPRPRRRRG